MIDELTLRPEVPNTPANQKKRETLKKKREREDVEIGTESRETKKR